VDKIIIFGNSSSGKSTLAKKLKEERSLAHLDLDTLAWLAGETPTRKPIEESISEIKAFTTDNDGWVIEGCYSDLIEPVLPFVSEIIFLDLPVDQCVKNARNRPWEPHKYESKEKQDANLDFLIAWIKEYDSRDDVFSRKAHQKLYSEFTGKKSRHNKRH
jgi:adenylate kinase family enzyme